MRTIDAKHWGRSFSARFVVKICSGIVIFLGFIAFVGWQTENIHLVQAGPTAPPFAFGSTLLFILLGFALERTVSKTKKRTGEILAIISLMASAFTLLSFFSHSTWSLPWLFPSTHFINQSVRSFSWVAPNSSLCFLLLSVSLLLARKPTLQGFIGAAIIGYVSVASLGYLSELSSFLKMGNFPPMAPQETWGFLLLSIGLYASMKKTIESEWLPYQLGLGLTVATVFLFIALKDRSHQRLLTNVDAAALSVKNELSVRFDSQVQPVAELAKYWGYEKYSEKNSARLVHELLARYRSWVGVKKLSKLMKYEWEVARNGEDMKDLTIPDGETQAAFLSRAMEGLQPEAVLSVDNPLEGTTMDVYFPLVSEDKFDGFLVLRIVLENFLDTTFTDDFLPHYYFTISDGTQTLYQRSGDSENQSLSRHLTTRWANHVWQVSVWPSSVELSRERSHLPETGFVLGLILSGLLSFLVWDIDKRKRYEKALLSANQSALEASRLKSDFVANMSHEIRTPLNAIVGMASLLAETKLQKEQKSYVLSIQDASETLLSLINDILDFSKIEAGKLEVENIDFSFVDVIKSTREMFLPLATKKGLELTTHFPPNIPKFFKGDPNRIRQILINLIGNAIKFTERGSISVELHAQMSEGCWRIETHIIDTGVGISDAAKHKIFGAFEQADTSTTRQFGGSGLGLSICKRLTELMKGKIEFKSQPGVGSDFWFTLTLDEGVESVIPKQNMKNLSFKMIRVLVAEDNVVNQQVIRKMLEKLGCIVRIVDNGEEALKQFTLEKFDIVLMDCQMPRMDGYEATRQLRKLDPKTNTPILALTAHALASDRKKCLDAGMDDYLAKPIDKNSLAKALQRWLTPARNQQTVKRQSEPNSKSYLDENVLAEVLSLEEDGNAFLSQLIDTFEKDGKNTIAELRKMLVEGNLVRVAELAHHLKSAAGNLGAKHLFLSCKRVEHSAKRKKKNDVRKHFKKMESDYDKSCLALSDFLQRKLGPAKVAA